MFTLKARFTHLNPNSSSRCRSMLTPNCAQNRHRPAAESPENLDDGANTEELPARLENCVRRSANVDARGAARAVRNQYCQKKCSRDASATGKPPPADSPKPRGTREKGVPRGDARATRTLASAEAPGLPELDLDAVRVRPCSMLVPTAAGLTTRERSASLRDSSLREGERGGRGSVCDTGRASSGRDRTRKGRVVRLWRGRGSGLVRPLWRSWYQVCLGTSFRRRPFVLLGINIQLLENPLCL